MYLSSLFFYIYIFFIFQLQLGEEFTSDILDDVQSLINNPSNITKPENVLTWL